MAARGAVHQHAGSDPGGRRHGSRGERRHGNRHSSRFPGRLGRVSIPRLRPHLVLVGLDCMVVIAGYGAAGITYHSERAPTKYWHILAYFLIGAVIVHVIANPVSTCTGGFGNTRGCREVRDVLLSSMVAVALLSTMHSVRHFATMQGVSLTRHHLGSLVTAFGTCALRFHTRLSGPHRRSRTRPPGGRHRMSRRRCISRARHAGKSGRRPRPSSRLR